MLEEGLKHTDAREFAWQLYTGTLSARDELDEQLQSVADNWRVSRMALTDRNVLRMGAYEMTRMGTPAAIVLDECIEIAKAYGSEKSAEFVNGILDKLVPQVVTEESGDTSEA